MALTRKDAVKFVHTDGDGYLYGVFIGLDGIGSIRAYPSVNYEPVYPDITYNSELEGVITVDAPARELWRTLPLNLKKVCSLYNGGLTIAQIVALP